MNDLTIKILENTINEANENQIKKIGQLMSVRNHLCTSQYDDKIKPEDYIKEIDEQISHITDMIASDKNKAILERAKLEVVENFGKPEDNDEVRQVLRLIEYSQELDEILLIELVKLRKTTKANGYNLN